MSTQLTATETSWKHLLSIGAVTHEVFHGSSANRRNLKIGTTSLQCVHIPTWISKSVLYKEHKPGSMSGWRQVIRNPRVTIFVLFKGLVFPLAVLQFLIRIPLYFLLSVFVPNFSTKKPKLMQDNRMTCRTSTTTALLNKERQTKERFTLCQE